MWPPRLAVVLCSFVVAAAAAAAADNNDDAVVLVAAAVAVMPLLLLMIIRMLTTTAYHLVEKTRNSQDVKILTILIFGHDRRQRAHVRRMIPLPGKVTLKRTVEGTI